MEPNLKKTKQDIFNFSTGRGVSTPEETEAAYAEAVRAHPFFDNAHSVVDLYDSATIRDGQGRIVGVLLRQALPEHAATKAADLLLSAAVRTSLRSSMFGGEAPLSGIAGYFDYRGSPVELKSRKTSFTYEHEKAWPAVFPLVDYVSAIYKRVMPQHWAAQDAAIPDIVRIHGTPFSTLTINSRFRTASHTDAGDFDGGYSCIACLDGNFRGLALTFDSFHVNVPMQPRDVLVFDSHHYHSNTEVELTAETEEWSRLSCVFYYRSALGEAHSYDEYNRRLRQALKDGSVSPAMRTIPVKPNGQNLNRPSPVFPIDPSPFSVVTALHRLQGCAARALRVHEALMRPASELAQVLFGEPLRCPDGIPLRGDDEKLRANADSTARPAIRSGGFSETDSALTGASDRCKYLDAVYLRELISGELLELWSQARARWLELVKKEWAHMIRVNPERTDFTWKNHSDMNSAFFDLCEVGKQVMLGLLDKEAATPQEEQKFWSLFALHLHTACAEELAMPTEAMSLRKLNVKLKDFSFGGTRYFKDMPAEEQQRRLARQRAIEEARRRGAAVGSSERRSSWLTNDSFDYQTEDCPVDYAGQGWELPELHAEAVTQGMTTDDVEASGEAVRVLVVLPRPSGGASGDGHVKVEETAVEVAARAPDEWARLLSSPAVHRLFSASPRNAALPAAVSVDGVDVAFAYHDELPSEEYDFVVLQHVLSAVHDDTAAARYLEQARALCSGCLLVVETDVQCRQYYTLKYPTRADYDTVATAFFQLLHRACYGTKLARTRTKAEAEALFPLPCCARFKMQGSPLNTVVHILAVD